MYMKKLSTIVFLMLVCVLSAVAQSDDTFYFVDANGKKVADGSTITVTDTEDDGFGTMIMKTGLYIKSDKTGSLYACMAYNILEMPNGAFQVCFPENCTQADEEGSYETPVGEVKVSDIQAEWLADDYGIAKVELQPKTYRHNNVTNANTFVGNGPKVTVIFDYSDPAGISGIEANGSKVVARYSLDGRVLSQPENGINIVKTDDGKVRKIMIKK